jgi:hypothetical protein
VESAGDQQRQRPRDPAGALSPIDARNSVDPIRLSTDNTRYEKAFLGAQIQLTKCLI